MAISMRMTRTGSRALQASGIVDDLVEHDRRDVLVDQAPEEPIRRPAQARRVLVSATTLNRDRHMRFAADFCRVRPHCPVIGKLASSHPFSASRSGVGRFQFISCGPSDTVGLR